MKAYGYFLKYIKGYEENTIRVGVDEVVLGSRKEILTEQEKGMSVIMRCPDLFMYGYDIG